MSNDKITFDDRNTIIELARTIKEVEGDEFPELRQRDDSFSCAPRLIAKAQPIGEKRSMRLRAASDCLMRYTMPNSEKTVENPLTKEAVLVSLAFIYRNELGQDDPYHTVEARAIRAIRDLNKVK